MVKLFPLQTITLKVPDTDISILAVICDTDIVDSLSINYYHCGCDLVILISYDAMAMLCLLWNSPYYDDAFVFFSFYHIYDSHLIFHHIV